MPVFERTTTSQTVLALIRLLNSEPYLSLEPGSLILTLPMFT